MIKFLILNAMLCSIITAQTTIKIYNQGRALVQEERQKKFSQEGKQKLIISNIPRVAESSSMNILSDGFEVISKEYIYHPISITSLLNANTGKEIELVKYGEDGSITFSTKGKLISNIGTPVFEIDGKIVVNPPYSYRFSDIPDGITDYPYLNCVINNSTKQTNYHLAYITMGLDWNAEFNLFLISDEIGELEGWYSIKNDNNITYKNAKISLVSGSVNFETSAGNPNFTKRRSTAKAYSADSHSIQPETSNSEEHVIFTLPEKITLEANSQIRHKFVTENKLPYSTIYHISHSLSRYRRNTPAQSTDIPVFVRYELIAKNIGNFQIPGGSFNVYEKENSNLTFIGAGSSRIVEKDDKIKLETGKTHDILCTFTIQGYKINKDSGKAELSVVFENRKDKAVSINWTEQFSDGRWNISNSNLKFEKLDAYRVLFTVKVSANSKKEINFTAQIDKE
tara:strand:+ start:2999 stop:4360 length:1362 start_codon:yes stop_codon:yes gene_type:complete